MVSMQDFQNVSRPGEISLCERDGRLCSVPVTEIDVSKYCNTNLHDYPDINISREIHHPSNAAASAGLLRDDRRTVMMPVNEPLIKRLTRSVFENSLVEALTEATTEENSETNPFISLAAKYVLHILNAANRVRIFFKPHLKDQGMNSIAKFAQTRDWNRSMIRCIKWHPNCFKIAVAANDDSIRIYTEDSGAGVPILKSHLQKCISSMAWRPFTASEIAVGCQHGILLWTLDAKPFANATRPLSQSMQLKHGNHFPVTSLEWSQNGNLLVSASIKDSDLLIWDVDLNRNTPLKRVGPPCALLAFSPDGYRLCSTTVGTVFRVWTTDRWTPERWTVPFGSIQTVAWSPCGKHLLFVTTDDPVLYSLQFVDEQLFTTTSIPKSALPVASLTKVLVGNVDVGGQAQSIAWDPSGKHLAIIFKDSASIVIFLTTINHHQLTIAPDCFLVGIGAEQPVHIGFQPIYPRKPSPPMLTIGWSSGRVQYFPFN